MIIYVWRLPPPMPEIGWAFHSLQKFWQSSIIMSRNKWWSSQQWCGFFLSKRWHLSSWVKNACHRHENHLPPSTQRHSIWVLNTEEPHMKLAWPSPQSKIMRIETSLFSPPLSPHTLEGTPCFRITWMNMSRTVSAVFFVLAWSPVTYYETWVWSCRCIMFTNFTGVSIHYTMNDNSPSDQLVVAIDMPQGIWPRDLIVCMLFLCSNLLSHPHP